MTRATRTAEYTGATTLCLNLAFELGSNEWKLGLAGISLVEAEAGIDQKTMLTIAASGYAGTDFIEGFMKSNMPK